MTARVWPIISQVKLSRSSFGASVMMLAAMLFSPQLVLAQFTQQGPKLVGTGAGFFPFQGFSIALSADGNTAIVGGNGDNNTGAVWVFTRSLNVWTQQGSKLVANDAVGPSNPNQGYSVAVSADGNTAIVGGIGDNSATGAVWVYTRSNGVWTQQGSKLVGTGAATYPYGSERGYSVAVSADGNTAIVGGRSDNAYTGATWVFTRSGGVWTQQGNKLVGIGAVFSAQQGYSVAVSADGNTAIVGGPADNDVGAVWVFTRSGGVWTQQGNKLVGTGAVGTAQQGWSLALSADGNTAIVGGPHDTGGVGATWVFTRSAGVWTQQGNELLGTGTAGNAQQGVAVALSADGNTAMVGGSGDNSASGAVWVYTRNGGLWTQQGSKLVGTGAVGQAAQGGAVALSGDGNTAIVGGPGDNSPIGAAWVFVQPTGTLVVSPTTNIAASGIQGEAFSPATFQYQLTSTIGSVNYAILGIPGWLNANFTSGTAATSPVTVTFSLINPGNRSPGAYTAVIWFTNTSNGQGNTSRTATLTVNAGTKDGCKDGGWQSYVSFPGPFKNQDQCVSYFAKLK
jgi:hypothetical protein